MELNQTGWLEIYKTKSCDNKIDRESKIRKKRCFKTR